MSNEYNDATSDSSEDINDFWGDLPEGVFDDGKDCDKEDDEDDEDGVDIRVPGREHLLILLDCSPDMFVPCVTPKMKDDDKNNKELVTLSPVDAVIQSLQTYARQTVRNTVTSKNGKHNGFGVHLFATRERQSPDLDEKMEKKLNAKYEKGKKKEDSSDEEMRSPSESDSSDDEDHEPKSSFSSNVTNMHCLIPLDVPGTDTIINLHRCLEPSKDDTESRMLDIKQEYGHPPEDHSTAKDNFSSSLKKAFRDISSIFRDAKCVRKPGTKHSNPFVGDDSKTVWIFTSNDDCGSEQDQDNLQGIVKDLKQSGVKIHVWPLPTKDRRGGFSAGSFFHQIVEMKQIQEDQELDLDYLMETQWKSIRKAFEVPLIFPDQAPVGGLFTKEQEENTQTQKQSQTQQSQSQSQDNGSKETKLKPGIMLNFYTTIQTQREPSKVKIIRQVGLNDEYVELERVKYVQGKSTGETYAKYVSSATAEEKKLEKQHPSLAKIGHYYKLKSGELILMPPEYVASLKRNANLCGDFACLVLLGFKPRDKIPFHYNVKSYFVYPEDTVGGGSVTAFAHLHQSMIKKSVVGIGELMWRRGNTSKLVAIHPFQEEMDEDEEEQTCPPGWVVTHLPLKGEVREMPSDLSTEEGFAVSLETLEATKQLVCGMYEEKFDATGSFFNPYLEKYWDYMEHQALKLEMADKSDEDYIQWAPSDKELTELHLLTDKLKLSLPEDEPGEPAKSKKRKKADENTDWKVELQQGNLDKYTNDELKKALKSYGKKTSGKKAALVECLTEAINEDDF